MTVPADPFVDEALDRIAELASRLWDVRRQHQPHAARWRRVPHRCGCCGQPFPCSTVLAAEGFGLSVAPTRRPANHPS